MRFLLVLAPLYLGLLCQNGFSQAPDSPALPASLAKPLPSLTPFAKMPIAAPTLEYLDYQQHVHSSSQNTQLGSRTKLDMAYQYRFNEDTALRFRMDIDPNKSSEDNKTSQFELRLFHQIDSFAFQADFDLKGDDYKRGATTVGPDTDSKDSWIAFNPSANLRLIYYPYNMGTEIGREFRTLDVARLYYIQGTPAFISNLPIEKESIQAKTVPGFEMQWQPWDQVKVYLGAGSVGFFYPASDDFNIEKNASSERWKVKEDRAYKGGFSFHEGNTLVLGEYAKHASSDVGGALLDSAWSLQLQEIFGAVVLDFERTWSRAGARPYRLSSEQNWFQDTTPFRPIFSDYYGERQDWLGKTDAATMLRFGYNLGKVTPFVALKHRGQYFIDRELESAQRLRNLDETASHGGLSVLSLGANYQANKFNFRPEINFLTAKNSVFGDRKDVREDRILSELRKQDTQLKFSLSYAY